MDAQELRILKKVSTILVKNLKGVVNKMIKTKLSMIDIKSNDVTKKDIVELDISWIYIVDRYSLTYPKEGVYLKMVFANIYIN